jgi:hypothetical protein
MLVGVKQFLALVGPQTHRDGFMRLAERNRLRLTGGFGDAALRDAALLLEELS